MPSQSKYVYALRLPPPPPSSSTSIDPIHFSYFTIHVVGRTRIVSTEKYFLITSRDPTRTNVCGGRRDGKRIRARKVNALSEEERDHFSLLDEFSRIERENRELPRRLRCHGCHDVSNDVWSLS